MKHSPVMRLVIRTGSAVNRTLYRMSGGRVGGAVRGAPVLLLVTTGRQSGRPRTVPLLYLRDGSRYAVVASYGGNDTHPAWYLNLQAHPEAVVQIRREHTTVRARDADDDERQRLWAGLVALYPGYEGYAEKTTRRIPVVLLEPA